MCLLGASLIVGSLFFEWINLPYGDTPGDTISLDGWTSLETGDTVFVFVALVIVGLVSRRRLRGPWALLLGLAATAVVVTFAVSTTPVIELGDAARDHDSDTAYDPYDFGPGLFIAAAGTVLILLAGFVEARAHPQAGSEPE